MINSSWLCVHVQALRTPFWLVVDIVRKTRNHDMVGDLVFKSCLYPGTVMSPDSSRLTASDILLFLAMYTSLHIDICRSHTVHIGSGHVGAFGDPILRTWNDLVES